MEGEWRVCEGCSKSRWRVSVRGCGRNRWRVSGECVRGCGRSGWRVSGEYEGA